MKLELKSISIHFLWDAKVVYIFFPFLKSTSTFNLEFYKSMTKKIS